ncbi:family 10 glycosylhydrolase [Microtetraspora sp. NBRC 16547]|uniref:glycoside hydrolase family 10 protein n=1 Tax=Microtetraspora sp. NBRC 16547 TaxID=3030993 RepID=UPI0024A38D1F|nr:family 10 glycosylhydrolase [Microtetraspora sp. NBRC 16547]GLX01930.1 glycosyl hydrolase [Microtetraspora sp. NBRC 16547]
MANREGRRGRAINEDRTAGRVLSVRGPLLASLVVAAASASAAYAFGPQPAPKTPTTVRTAAAAETCTASGSFPKRQLRGVWIATVHNSDWPSRTGLTPARQRAEYTAILDNAVKRRLNAVFVQVRPASDAIYRSSLEPWSQYLTGTPGKDPGWDPLPFLISEAHKRGLEFQAWFNPYRAAFTTDVSALPEGHPARVHPEWTVKHEGRLYYNPGLPEVRDWVTKVVTDVVRRYDVDGVHFDDYFYPYPGNGTRFADAAAHAAYGKGVKLADWRRDNVNKLVAQVSKAVHQTKPYVKFGISPFGIWRNKSDDPKGSDTKGMSAYDAIYADAKAWIRAGSVDYLVPQLYWPRGFSVADYEALVPWWAEAVRGSDVDLYIGQALYRVGTKDTPAWTKPAEMPSHLTVNRQYPEVKGDVYFSAASLATNPLGVLDRIVKNHYTRPALLPVIKGLPATAPAAPASLKSAAGTLTWSPSSRARAYAVYRASGKNADCTTVDAHHLVAVVSADDRLSYTAEESGDYYVTALDRLNNESAPAQVKVTLP